MSNPFSGRLQPAAGRVGDLPRPGAHGRLGGSSAPAVAVILTLILFAIAAAAVVALIMLVRRLRRRRAVREILDAADALEDRLRTARDEIEAVAGDQPEDPVQDALREMLRQRLWLRDHGNAASLDDLQEVRSGIDNARERIERQLDRIEEARAPQT
ncbi:hypothetical protein [Marilutibacter maris]|uniref:hypothetical protein n=1 Tax=Marilutibacter maris TaxID=1605891 RepID=UPI0011445D24|nr:hypothetical protein [Lysobacter maris]